MDLSDIVSLSNPVVGGVAAGVIANWGSYVIAKAIAPVVAAARPSRRKLKDNALDGYVGLSPEFGALDYLNLASAVVHNHTAVRKGFCWDFAAATFEAYQQLVRRNGRPDISRKLRKAITMFTNGDSRKEFVSHMFLEVKLSDSTGFVSYESTDETPDLNPYDAEAVMVYSTESLPEKMIINGDARDYVNARTIPGTVIAVPSRRAFTEMPLGSVQLFYLFARNFRVLRAGKKAYSDDHASKNSAAPL